jgi:hypothetical protein
VCNALHFKSNNVATTRNIEVISGRFNMVTICSNGVHAIKLFSKLYNYPADLYYLLIYYNLKHLKKIRAPKFSPELLTTQFHHDSHMSNECSVEIWRRVLP